MKAGSVGLVIAAAVVLGLVLGWNYLKGIRNPVLNGVHLLLGAGAFEGVALMMHGRSMLGEPLEGAESVGGSMGGLVLAMLGVAMLSGLIWALVRGQWRGGTSVLVAHAGVGTLVLVFFVIWAARF
jgi:hypothetical protein